MLILIVENWFDGILVYVCDYICFSFADEGDQIGVVCELVFSLGQFTLYVLEHRQELLKVVVVGYILGFYSKNPWDMGLIPEFKDI